MTDAEKILARLDAIDERLSGYDQLIKDLGCAEPENMRADGISRDLIKGVIAVGKLWAILSAIGRFVLMFGGLVTAFAALLSHWKGAP